MNLLFEKNEDIISLKVPHKLKTMIIKAAKKLNMSNSQYIKLALIEKLEKDKTEK